MMVAVVERFEGRGWLEWWANSSTMLGSAEVSVTIVAAAGSDWRAQASLISHNVDDREGFMFLCDLDPVFLLRFAGEGTVPVTVRDIQNGGRRFSLTEYHGPAQRSVDHQIDM